MYRAEKIRSEDEQMRVGNLYLISVKDFSCGDMVGLGQGGKIGWPSKYCCLLIDQGS